MKRVLLLLALATILPSCSHQPIKTGLGREQSSSTPKNTAQEEPAKEIANADPAIDAPLPPQTGIRIREISRKGNFFKIDRGARGGIKMGELFGVIGEQENLLLRAEVVALRPDSAFLRVKEQSPDVPMIRLGQEVRRIVRPKQH